MFEDISEKCARVVKNLLVRSDEISYTLSDEVRRSSLQNLSGKLKQERNYASEPYR